LSENGGTGKSWTCIHRWSKWYNIPSTPNTHPIVRGPVSGGIRNSERQMISHRHRARVDAALGGASVHQDGEMVLSHMAFGRLTSRHSHSSMWILGAHTLVADSKTLRVYVVLQYSTCIYIEMCLLPLRASVERPRP